MLPGIEPGTVFHYRLIASHGPTATTTGADVTFATLPWPRPPHQLELRGQAAVRKEGPTHVYGARSHRPRLHHVRRAWMPRNGDDHLLPRPYRGRQCASGRQRLMRLRREHADPRPRPRPGAPHGEAALQRRRLCRAVEHEDDGGHGQVRLTSSVVRLSRREPGSAQA